MLFIIFYYQQNKYCTFNHKRLLVTIPFEPVLFGYSLNIHLVLEYLAFFIGFRYFIYLRKRQSDTISKSNRLSIILGAIIGAFLGSRLIGFLENPLINFYEQNIITLFNTKTIMGGLFGGLIGVELAKLKIKELQSSGDLFTFPIIIGILIGRIGCFLSGTNEFTYGIKTNLFTSMDLGDGLLRHPIALYEIVFLIFLFFLFKKAYKSKKFKQSGDLFKWFMISYFSFRFCIEFIKPNTFLILNLSSIQYLCIFCILYYRKTFKSYLLYAN